jgi:hypothetical protein
MVNLLVAISLVPWDRAENGAHPATQEARITRTLQDVHALLNGLVATMRVREGMTQAQVELILGTPSASALSSWGVCEYYDSFALQVFWSYRRMPGRAEQCWVVRETAMVWSRWLQRSPSRSVEN